MQIKTGTEVNVVKDNKMQRGTVTAVRDGLVDATLADGTTIVSGLKHVSQGDKMNCRYHKRPDETVGQSTDPNVIEVN